jgi:hypothetical protein
VGIPLNLHGNPEHHGLSSGSPTPEKHDNPVALWTDRAGGPVLRGRLSDGIALEGGGGYFLRGDLIEATLSDQKATWGYLQASGSF